MLKCFKKSLYISYNNFNQFQNLNRCQNKIIYKAVIMSPLIEP